MKLTSHTARVDTAGRHNDRNFDTSKAKHIDEQRMSENKYYTYNGEDRTFRDIELDYYREHFSESVKEQNRKNASYRKSSRNRTIEQVYASHVTQPEDLIIQIGDKDEHISGEQLWDLAVEYQKRFDERYGVHCKILTMSLHVDEATPHVHVRRIWKYIDEDGNEHIGQTRALDAMGYTRPDMSEPESRWNNAKIAFSAADRAIQLQICEEMGIEIETEKKPKRRHLSKEEFIERDDLEREIKRLRIEKEETEDEITKLQEQLKDEESESDNILLLPIFQGKYDKLHKQIKKLSRKERQEIINEVLAREKQFANASRTLSEYLIKSAADKSGPSTEDYKSFIDEMGYNDEFEQFIKEQNKKDRKKFKEKSKTCNKK